MAAEIPQERIRNFCIVAHIDHGKSTLADRLLEMRPSAITEREKKRPVPRQHGSRARARDHDQGADRTHELYIAEDGEEYVLNLIDTPGHVDFSYEVSRALAACEGAAPDRRRGSGHRSPDPRERLPRGRRRSRADPGHQQDRPAFAPTPTPRRPGGRGYRRARCRRRVCRFPRRRGRASKPLLQAIVEQMCRRPTGDREAPAQRARLRCLVRPLRRRRHARPRHRTARSRSPRTREVHGREGSEHEITQLNGDRSQAAQGRRSLGCRRGGHAIVAGVKSLAEVQIGDTITLGLRSGQPKPRCRRLPGSEAHGLLGALSRSTPKTTKT